MNTIISFNGINIVVNVRIFRQWLISVQNMRRKIKYSNLQQLQITYKYILLAYSNADNNDFSKLVYNIIGTYSSQIKIFDLVRMFLFYFFIILKIDSLRNILKLIYKINLYIKIYINYRRYV